MIIHVEIHYKTVLTRHVHMPTNKCYTHKYTLILYDHIHASYEVVHTSVQMCDCINKY